MTRRRRIPAHRPHIAQLYKGTVAHPTRPFNFNEVFSERHRRFSTVYVVRALDIRVHTTTNVLSLFVKQLLRHVKRCALTGSPSIVNFGTIVVPSRKSILYFESPNYMLNVATARVSLSPHVAHVL